MVQITFRGPIATRMGGGRFTLNLTETTRLIDVLQQLITAHGEIRTVWTDIQVMDRETLILRNGVDIGLTGGLDTEIQQSDTILVVPLVHGG
jgi:molybdopterin converting factor small subunit